MFSLVGFHVFPLRVSCFPSWGFMFSLSGFHVFPRGVSCSPCQDTYQRFHCTVNSRRRCERYKTNITQPAYAMSADAITDPTARRLRTASGAESSIRSKRCLVLPQFPIGSPQFVWGGKASVVGLTLVQAGGGPTSKCWPEGNTPPADATTPTDSPAHTTQHLLTHIRLRLHPPQPVCSIERH